MLHITCVITIAALLYPLCVSPVPPPSIQS
jgi:hypothetical protein